MPVMRTSACAALAFVVSAWVFAAPVRALDTVTIGTVGSPSANLWPIFIGIDKGFFAAENIKPDLVYVPASAAVIQQLAAGSLDMTMSTGLVDPIRAIDQGAARHFVFAGFEDSVYYRVSEAGYENENGSGILHLVAARCVARV